MLEVIILGLAFLFLAIGFALDRGTKFIEKLKTSDSISLKNGFQANLSVASIDKKSEDVLPAQPPQND